MTRGLAAGTLSALVIASMVSCGGASFDGDEDGGSGGSSGSSAGSTSKGGSVNRGGASTGGTNGTAGTMTAAGTGPAGGSVGTAGTGTVLPPELCSLPPESGNCDAYFPSFFHNPETGVCEPFVYGGCGGNDNRFESVTACQDACRGSAPNLDGCQSPQECVLVSPHCCGVCDGTLQDYTAVNLAGVEAFKAAHACGDVACEPCPPTDPTIANRPYLTATCRDGECVPIDIREEGVTDCSAPEDCYLRAGLSCCEDCGADASQLVAVSDGGKLGELVCGDQLQPCLACLPAYPPGYAAECDAGAGRCVLTYVP